MYKLKKLLIKLLKVMVFPKSALLASLLTYMTLNCDTITWVGTTSAPDNLWSIESNWSPQLLPYDQTPVRFDQTSLSSTITLSNPEEYYLAALLQFTGKNYEINGTGSLDVGPVSDVFIDLVSSQVLFNRIGCILNGSGTVKIDANSSLNLKGTVIYGTACLNSVDVNMPCSLSCADTLDLRASGPLLFDNANFLIANFTATNSELHGTGYLVWEQAEDGFALYDTGVIDSGTSLISACDVTLTGAILRAFNQQDLVNSHIKLNSYIDPKGRFVQGALCGAIGYPDETAVLNISGTTFIKNVGGIISRYGTVSKGFYKYINLKDEAQIENTGTVIDSVAYPGEIATDGLSIFSLQGSCQLRQTALGVCGPAFLDMHSGGILNEGVLTIGGTLFDGSVTGGGTIQVFEVFKNQAPFSQGFIQVGYNDIPGVWNLQSQAEAARGSLILAGSRLAGTGSLSGSLSVKGIVAPGVYDDILGYYQGRLNLLGQTHFAPQSLFLVDIANGQSNRLDMTQQLTIDPSSNLAAHVYTFFTQPFSCTVTHLQGGTINGLFALQKDQPLISYQLNKIIGLQDQSLVLQVSQGPFADVFSESNLKAIGKVLDQLNQKTNDCLQSKIDALRLDGYNTIYEAVKELDPSEFYGMQMSLEELIFTINDEYKNFLYQKTPSIKPFIGAGINYQRLKPHHEKPGYVTRSIYEYIGLTYGQSDWKTLAALGSLQSWTHFKKEPSLGSDVGGFAALGAAYFKNRWEVGFDSLGGYYHLNTQRDLNFYALKAKASHNMWNIKGMLHAAYNKTFQTSRLKIYDDLIYYYGNEGSFQETGANCLDLEVSSKHRQVLRNAFGLKGIFLTDEKVNPYIDVAYVWEDRFASQNYSSRFTNTSPSMTTSGMRMPPNLCKLNLGLETIKNKTKLIINISGLYGTDYLQQDVSFSLETKF